MRYLLSFAAGLLVTSLCTHAADSLTKSFWDADKLLWGDGRPYEKPVKKEGPYPQGFRADFIFDVPATGWYEVVFPETQGDVRHDLYVDGGAAWKNRPTSALDEKPAAVKAGNLWLTKGSHTLRVDRTGRMAYPIRIIGGVALRAADGRVEAEISAAKTRVDIMRMGEKFEIKVTGGGVGRAESFELLRTELGNPSARPEVVGEVTFASGSAPETKDVAIPCPAAGAFSLGARIKGGKNLSASEFPIGVYGVVDVSKVTPGSGRTEVVHEIDCVKQTDLGKPLAPSAFREVNGPTHVVTRPAGTYRESHDCTPPEAEAMRTPDDPHSFSGFAYEIMLPEVQVPYLVDIEFPDDARRSVTAILNWIDEKTGGFAKGTKYGGKGYDTGGLGPLSGQMQHLRMVVWAASPKLIIGIISQQIGQRAAVSKITVSRFADGMVPATKVAQQDGRIFAYWYEEAGNWESLVNVGAQYPDGLVHDMVGLERWARLCRYFGMNGISACGLGYQSAFWRNTTLPGFGSPSYDMCRLAALICEKYGMAFIPEVYPSQWYANLVTLPEKAENPNDVRAVSCHGALVGPGSAPTDLNALHPAVQQMWIDGIGELSDKLRDVPSFKGVTVRADGWGFRGDFNLPSLNWGYGDWTARTYEKETGVKLPGDGSDQGRFLERYKFLTSPAQRDKWITWRSEKILDYHKRLRDRIRGDRKDLFFGIAGDFTCDLCYQMPDSVTERALGSGVDIARVHKEDGLVIMPYARYGKRNLGIVAQQDYDGFLDPENVGIGKGETRAFSAYMTYNELAHSWPAEKFGVAVAARQAPYYCSSAVAAGRNSLEKFAVVLAEQDSTLLRDGGNADICGDPAIWNEWFSEFEALPMLPFTPVDTARDPVAVWFLAVSDLPHFKPGLYFYAINREQFPVRVELALEGGAQVDALGSGKSVALANAKLALDLQPYELRAFRAAVDAKITAVTTICPPDKVDAAKTKLAFAQDLHNLLAEPQWKKAVPPEAQADFERQLDAAWEAFKTGSYWRTRTALTQTPALKVYDALARLPKGQFVTEFPGLLKGRPNEGHWLPRRITLQGEGLATLASDPKMTISAEMNPEWRDGQVLMAKDGALELDLDVPASGLYSLTLGHVAAETGTTVATLDGKSLPVPMVTAKGAAPETFAFPPVKLKQGKAHLTLRRDGAFGLYALQLVPHLRPMPNTVWSTVGPFKSFWGLESGGRKNEPSALAKGLDTPFIPEDAIDIRAKYDNGYGKKVGWTQKNDPSIGDVNDTVVAMPSRTGSANYDVNYAVCYIVSDADRVAQLDLATDWWGKAWLNGEPLRTKIDPKLQAECGGADFTSWYPYPTTLKLRKGVNTLLVKQHGGSLGSGIAGYITDEPGIVCQAVPPAE